jgi:hypothetical protein
MGVHDDRAVLFEMWIPAAPRKIFIDAVEYKRVVCSDLLRRRDDKEASLNVFSRSDSLINFLLCFKCLHVQVALFFDAIWASYSLPSLL